MSLSGTGQAQGLSMLTGGSDPGASTIVDRAEIAAAARASFVEALVTQGENTLRGVRDVDGEFVLGTHVVSAQDRYEKALSATLDELQADGVVTLSEITEALPPVRKAELDRFADVVQARSAGFAPPPQADAYDSASTFALAMARYVALQRNAPRDWLILCGWILGGLLAAWSTSAILGAAARRADNSAHQGFYRSVAAIRVPLLLAAATIGALIGLDAVWKPNAMTTVVTSSLGTLILLFLFWACWNLSAVLAASISRFAHRVSDVHIGATGRLVVTRVLRLVFIVVFALIATKFVLGASVTGILAGLGIVGVVLWFLLQGLIENLAASFTLFGDQSISVGDTIIYKDQWGVIEDIGFRTTRFRTFDGHLVTIPNSNMISDSVENVSRRPSIRRRFTLGISYDTSAEQIGKAVQIIRSAIESHSERITSADEINVHFQNFGNSSLQLLVQYFAATTDYWDAEALHEEINREILQRFADADIVIPFPTQTTILKSDKGEPARLRIVSATDATDTICESSDAAVQNS